MPGVKFYEKEYAFDGDESTFFCTPYSDLEGEHFTVTLDSPTRTRRVAVAFDDSKEYPHGAVLEASADGKIYYKVADEVKGGRMEARFKTRRKVKALRLTLTREQQNRLTIREFYFR